MRLKYYSKERVEFKDCYEKTLTYDELDIIFKKLCRHFKIHPFLYFGRGSHAGRFRVQISNKWGLNFGVLCHEMSHTYCAVNSYKRGHNKYHWRVMKRFMNYCRKKNFWNSELSLRTEVRNRS